MPADGLGRYSPGLGEHYAALAADATGQSQDAQHWEFLDPHLQTNAWIQFLDEQFKATDIWTALRKTKAHRAPGGTGSPLNC